MSCRVLLQYSTASRPRRRFDQSGSVLRKTCCLVMPPYPLLLEITMRIRTLGRLFAVALCVPAAISPVRADNTITSANVSIDGATD
jgi:hypothetical protein